ncbi:MAG: hypothetical protein F6K04_19015 [Leptolyngbya sp. SIO4C5]|nr:hypothetical protein [Leptolyngbya sp. SIO4C5]
MALNTPNQATNTNLEEALSKVALLNQLIPKLKQQLTAERENPPTSQEDMAAKIAKAQMELDKLEAKLTKAKQAVKKRKKEIDEWKSWYNSNPQINKSISRIKLEVEITWRSQEIAAHETVIATLEAAKLAARGELEKRKLQLKAFSEGLYELSVEADPRLLKAKEALVAARAELQALQTTRASL